MDAKAVLVAYNIIMNAIEETKGEDATIEANDWRYVIESIEGALHDKIQDVLNFPCEASYAKDLFSLFGEMVAILKDGKNNEVIDKSIVNSLKEKVIFLAGGEIRVWVNVYHITRHFGGREEGGWYYNWRDCIEAHNVTYDEAENLHNKLKGEHIGEGDIYSVLGGHQVDIRIESMREESKDTVTPRYE